MLVLFLFLEVSDLKDYCVEVFALIIHEQYVDYSQFGEKQYYYLLLKSFISCFRYHTEG